MFQWHGFFDLGEKLQSECSQVHGDLENACLRTAASRFYLFSFNLARKHAESNYGYQFNPDDNQGTHKHLIDYYKQDCSHPNSKAIGTDLDRCKKVRSKCDYDESVSKLDMKAALAHQLAKEIEQNLESS